mgnify:CR=1 FL=1|tara:strand:- start:3084 stop:3671 length:588 start_codon:yes stop_codon:yes gene_type:complete
MPKYNSIENIPAKAFFDILDTKNYQLLKPKPSEEGLEKVFTNIYDDFFIKSDNYESKQYLKLTTNIAFLDYKIATIKQILHFIYYNKITDEMKLNLLDALEKGCEIYIDKNAEFVDELQRILQVEIGIIENDLTMEKLELNNMAKNRTEKIFDFYDNIVSLSNVHNRNIDEKLTLAMYVSIEKSATRIIKEQNKK